MARFSFDLGTVQLQRKTRDMAPRIENAVNQTMLFGSAKGVEHMKTNAPWTDRTGNARAGLHVVPDLDGNKKTLTFAHTMSYGIWLEVIQNGKYQIIMPTVKLTGQQIMASLRRTLDKL